MTYFFILVLESQINDSVGVKAKLSEQLQLKYQNTHYTKTYVNDWFR